MTSEHFGHTNARGGLLAKPLHDRELDDGLDALKRSTRGLGLGVPKRCDDIEDVARLQLRDRLVAKHREGVRLHGLFPLPDVLAVGELLAAMGPEHREGLLEGDGVGRGLLRRPGPGLSTVAGRADRAVVGSVLLEGSGPATSFL